ncbi:MAG: hypothetical protein ABFR33_09575 [Verrucomicrobiota bacterium]
MKKSILFVLSGLVLTSSCQGKTDMPSKEQQLKDLQKKQILVAMWGWAPDEIGPAAKRFGYEVVNQPQNNEIDKHAKDIPVWIENDYDMIVRPHLYDARDPFDAEQVKKAYSEVEKVIRYHEKNNPRAVAYVLQWGMFGEGGFEWGYKFSDKAKKAFNDAVGTPDEPLPEGPAPGVPGSMRWIQWLEFRAKFLRQFRTEFLEHAKQFTGKLVGTWCEVYPTDNYILNMGDAPGADFVFYDLSFGDVTCYQTKAFGESHGEMEAFPTFEAWLDHELPLMAKAAGEGVVPMAFQFPMRKGHAVDNIAGRKQYTVDKVEDEYSLKLGPYIRELIDAVDGKTRKPEVALVFHSFQAAALPGGGVPQFPGNNTVDPLYSKSSKQIESSMHQMGIDIEVIPYEWLEYHDLAKYKLVIVPDPMYLPAAHRANLEKANRVLYSGEYLLAHRDEASATGNYKDEFKATTLDGELGKISYFKNKAGIMKAKPSTLLMKGVEFKSDYPADQMFAFEKMPEDSKVLATVNGKPAIFTRNGGKAIHVANRAFLHAWHSGNADIEKGMFQFLKNILVGSGVTIRVASPMQVRGSAKADRDTFCSYGSYGISGHIAWNATGSPIQITMADGQEITIPKYGWTKVE